MKYKTHLFYVAGILIAIIIFLLTYKFGNNEKLIDYLNFGLTFTSLFLALIAIIYAFISNSTVSNNLSSISNAANDISNVSKLLELTNNSIVNTVSDLPQMIKGVEEKVDKSGRIIQEMRDVRDEARLIQKEEGGTEFQYTKEEINLFLDTASFNILTVIYVLKISKERQLSFELKKILDLSHIDVDTSYGILTTLSAVYMININDLKDIITVTKINGYLVELVESKINDRAEDLNKKYLEKFGNQDVNFNNTIITIDKYFNEESWNSNLKLVFISELDFLKRNLLKVMIHWYPFLVSYF